MGPWLSISCGTATDRPTHSLPLRNASRKALSASWWIRTQHLADFYWPVQMCADIRGRFIHSNDASNEDYVEPNVMKCPFFWGGDLDERMNESVALSLWSLGTLTCLRWKWKHQRRWKTWSCLNVLHLFWRARCDSLMFWPKDHDDRELTIDAQPSLHNNLHVCVAQLALFFLSEMSE